MIYNIITKPVNNFEGWFNKALIRDNCDHYNYFRTTQDNRIKNMFSNISPIESEYEYCGGFISSQDNLVFIGEDPNHKNLWYYLGYGANGILFTILEGMMLSKLYKGETDENLKLFRINRFDN